MDFWPEFLASSWGKEFVAGGFGGAVGIMAGYPLDTLRIRQQQAGAGSALGILRQVLASEGLRPLYRGMAAPLASVTFQNAMVFQIYALLSRAFDRDLPSSSPPSYKGVALGGMGTGAIQSLILSPVELVKIRLQLQKPHDNRNNISSSSSSSSVTIHNKGPIDVAKKIFRQEGLRGVYRGLTITVLRDAPAHGWYFCTYEYMREKLHPGCRITGQETVQTMLVAGGVAGVASWISCYPLDVIKTRLQAQSDSLYSPPRYSGIVDCFRQIVKEEGHMALWRGLGTAVTRAFLVNGAIFTAYETALRCISSNNTNTNNHAAIYAED